MSKIAKKLEKLEKLEKQFRKLIGADKPKKNIAKVEELLTIVEANRFYRGRMISGSKGSYSVNHPKSVAIFNANMVVESCGKIWHGDLDITKSGNKLKELAKKCGEPIYILREMDCRFDTENDPIKDLMKRAVWNTNMEVIKGDV